MIKHTDFNEIKKWKTVPFSQLGHLLQAQGFKYAKTFSTDEIKMFKSDDNKYTIVFNGNLAKVYAAGNMKQYVHMFSVVSG